MSAPPPSRGRKPSSSSPIGLEPDARIRSLSKGQRARLGLIAAEAHRPDLLILDEPSSGLDPIVRRDILEAIIRTVTEEGRTVIFSSHLLDEVERVSDHLALLNRGALRLCAPLEDVKARHRRISLRFDTPQAQPPNVPGAIRIDGAAREWTVICDAAQTFVSAMAQSLRATTSTNVRLRWTTSSSRTPSLQTHPRTRCVR